ncbi:MAG: recombination regulator RecX [candidate division KSB1 bacterium]|nr:recombination regulator RecX [candidate division KSB1 bacterium]
MLNEGQQSFFDDAASQQQFHSALAKAYRLLAVRARSEKELREALKRAGFAQEMIDSVIADCKQQGFVDDAGFARQFVQNRLRNRPAGRARLAVELRQKGIEASTIASVLDEVLKPANQIELAEQLAQKQRKRLANLPPPKARQRLADFLRRRGFDWETIQGTELWKELDK